MRICALVLCVVAAVGCGEVAGTIIDAAPDGTGIDGGVTELDAPIGCAGLDPLACRDNAACVADFCESCDCTPTYQGCRAIGAPRNPCPILDCPALACCRGDADCTNIECRTPDDPRICGICQVVDSECTSDAQCQTSEAGVGAPLICQPIICACDSSANRCVPGCSRDEECGAAEACDLLRGRCGPQACSAAAPCPADFDCTAGSCARRACTTDATCDGFCVESRCRDALGVCSPPPA